MHFENERLITAKGDILRIAGVFEKNIDDPAHLLRVFDKVENELPDSEKKTFRQAWFTDARRYWPQLKTNCFDVWRNSVERVWRPDGEEFKIAVGMLSNLPGAEEPEWLAWCLEVFYRRLSRPDGFHFSSAQYWLEWLKQFRCWTGTQVRRLLQEIDEAKQAPALDTISNVLASPAISQPADRISIALTFLMRERNRLALNRDKLTDEQIEVFEREKHFIGTLPEGAGILRLFALLKDLPTPHYDRNCPWYEFGPDERSAWRAEVVSAAAHREVQRHGLIEHLLWQTRSDRNAPGLYSEVELIVLALCTTEGDTTFIANLQRHVSRLVSVRASALLSHMTGGRSESSLISPSPDGITLAAASQALAVAGGAELPARTWIQDRAVERTIFTAVQRVEQAFSAEYARTWGLEEEMHLATLLTELQTAFKNANGVLDALASQGIVGAPAISFTFRQITKHEEGARGVGIDRFSVDVAFLIRVTDAGKQVTKRATFIQCKKLSANKAGVWHPSFEIDRLQCDDLIKQTESSFYMFLTPPFAGNEIWMMPARLVRNTINLHGPRNKGGRSRLPRAPTYFASRSLAHWVTYDLFGLWVGDERSDIVQKAERCEPGYSPRFVVTVVLHKNPTGDEAPNRAVRG